MPRTPRAAIDQRLLALASRQHGVIHAEQVQELGISRSSLNRRVRAGQLCLVLPRVYAVGIHAHSLEDAALMQAALLYAGGPPARLSHQTAASVRGFWDRGDGEIHVTSRRDVRARIPRVSFHSSALDLDRVELVGGMPVSSVARMVLELGTQLTEFQIARVLDEASFHGAVDLARIDEVLDQAGRSPGVRTARRGVELHREGSAGTRSRSEDEYLAGVLEAGLPEPKVNTRNAINVRGIEPDFAWVPQRLIVELDGGGHDKPGKREQDQRNDELLDRCGWVVLRFPSREVWRRRSSLIRATARALATSRNHVPT